MAIIMKCDDCGASIMIGMWPYCPHEVAQPRKGYEPHWDNHITDHPVWISDPGDKRKHLKEQWRNDQLIKVVEAG